MASTFLTRTNSSSPSNANKATFSCWIKLSKILGSSDSIGIMGSNDPGGYGNAGASQIGFFNGGFYVWLKNSSGTFYKEKSTRKLRDPNAWYHIVVRLDSTQVSGDNRIKAWINNEEVTAWDNINDLAQNTPVNINGQNDIRIGRYTFTGGSHKYFDGIISHFHLCDGQTYSPSDFGETDSTTGEWKIKTDVSVTYGTNGFFVLKDGNSLTDQSPNTNNFTVGGGTLTKTEDCPSNVFATINPLVRNKSYNDGTLTNGNLGFAPNGRAITCSTLGVTSGKYYAEFKATDAGGIYIGAGLMKGVTAQGQPNPIWYDNATGYVIAIANNGNLESGTNEGSTSYGSSFTDNDIICLALDMDNKEMYIRKNGDAWMNSGNPTSGASKTGGVTGATSYNPFDDGEEVFFVVADVSAGGVGECQCNFGNGYFGTTQVATAGANASGNGIFEFDVPAGYTALSTKGLNL